MSEPRKHPEAERLEAYVEESLDRAEHARIHGHLTTCAECRGEVEELTALFGALSDLATFAPSQGFADRVMSNVRIRRPAFAGAEAWVERLVPRTTRGWAAAAAMLALPVLGMTLLTAWILSQPGVTPQGLWLMAGNLVTEGLSASSQWIWGRFAGSSVALWLTQLTEFVEGVGRGEIGLVVVLFATLTAGSAYVLYQNLFRSDARRTEHATYVF